MSWSDEFLTAAIEEHCQKAAPPDLCDKIMQRATAAATAAPRHADATSQQPFSKSLTLPANRRTSVRNRLASAAIAVIAATVVVGVWQTSRSDEAQDPQRWLPLQRGAMWHYHVNGALADGSDGEWDYTESASGGVRLGGRNFHVLVSNRSGIELPASGRLVACDNQGVWQDLAWDPLYWGTTTRIVHRLLATPVATGATWHWRRETPQEVLEFEGEIIAADEPCTVPAGTFHAVHVCTTTTTTRKNNARKNTVSIEHAWYARGTGLLRKTVTRDAELLADAQLTQHDKGQPAWQPLLKLPEQLAKSPLHELGMPDEVVVVPLGIERLNIDSAFLRVRHGTKWQLWRMTRERLMAFDPSSMDAWNALVADEGLFLPPKHHHTSIALHLSGVAGRLHAASNGLTASRDPVFTDFNAFEGQATVNMDSVLSLKKDGVAKLVSLQIEIKRGKVVLIGLL